MNLFVTYEFLEILCCRKICKWIRALNIFNIGQGLFVCVEDAGVVVQRLGWFASRYRSMWCWLFLCRHSRFKTAFDCISFCGQSNRGATCRGKGSSETERDRLWVLVGKGCGLTSTKMGKGGIIPLRTRGCGICPYSGIRYLVIIISLCLNTNISRYPVKFHCRSFKVPCPIAQLAMLDQQVN